MCAAVTTSYISCGCNRTPQCADWGLNGLVCYGACRGIALYELKVRSRIINRNKVVLLVNVGDNTVPSGAFNQSASDKNRRLVESAARLTAQLRAG